MAKKCPKCSSYNPDTQKFCGDCGTQLPSAEEGPPLVTKTLETPQAELARGALFAGRYEVIEELGKGGMGRVYRVYDKKAREDIALKFIKPEIAADRNALARFRDELTIARKIRHKNICGMYDLGEDRGTHYLTMEYVPGEDLRSFIRRSGRLAIHKALAIAKEVCEALNEAHRLGVIHRDLKPVNIMIDKEGNVRIMDFGIALLGKVSASKEVGVIIGTPGYMSPEQAGGKPVDFCTDIYSLGVIMYEMLTGDLPSEVDPSDSEVLIPEDLKRIIQTCLESNKENRWRDARELLQALKDLGKPGTEETKSTHWKTSIAVLPFKNMSADPEQDYFCEGLAEELINVLTQFNDLRVVARTSAFSFRDKEQDIREIGRKLNVEQVLEGSVRKADRRLRITAQLINVADGYHLWSERFDREMEDVFEIQDEIAQAVSKKMKLLGVDEESSAKRYTKDLEAYNLYLKGIYWRRMLTVERVSKSIEYFKLAIERDPKFALAYAAMAYAYQVLYFYSPNPSRDYYLIGKENALKALDLDEQLAEAHEAYGVIIGYLEFDWKQGVKAFRRALELNPGYAWAHFHLANIFLFLGRYSDALKESEKANRFDPINVAFKRNLGLIHFRSGHFEEAEDIFKQAIEMDPFIPALYSYLGSVFLKQSRYEDALAMIKKDTLTGGVRDLLIGIVYAGMGKRDEALRVLDEWRERSRTEFISSYYMALLHFALGKNDEGFEWLEKGFTENDGWMINIKNDFLLDSIRDDPRYAALLKKMNLAGT